MKKILSFIFAVVLLLIPMCVETYASDSDVNYDDLVMPCYTYLDSISSGISEAALGFVNCTSNFISFDNGLTFVLTCTLQRTDGSYAWEAYKTKTETYTGKGSYTISKTWFAPANYAYRVYTTLTIKNSAGTVVETATKASGVIYKL